LTEAERELAMVRRGLDAFSRGAFDEALASMHPEIEWHLTFRVPDLPPDKLIFRGRTEVRELWEQFTGAWTTISIEIEEIVAAQPGIVVARTRFHGLGPGSGVEVDRVVFYVYGIEDELLRSIRPFDTEAEALDAAGLGDA
jgi:ketosteroid isomerase-like protein